MSRVGLNVQIDSAERDAFVACCGELGLTQAEVVRSLLRQWVAIKSNHAIVLPGNVAALFIAWAEKQGYLAVKPELPGATGE